MYDHGHTWGCQWEYSCPSIFTSNIELFICTKYCKIIIIERKERMVRGISQHILLLLGKTIQVEAHLGNGVLILTSGFTDSISVLINIIRIDIYS